MVFVFEISRNAPCPCGSGKKYKMCCVGQLPRAQVEHYGLLNREQTIKDKLVRWAAERFGQGQLDNYVRDFNGKKLEELGSEEDFAGFFEWFFLEVIHKQSGKRMLELVLEESSELFDQVERAIIAEWINKTQAGIFEVEDADENLWKLRLREIFSGKTYEVTDRKASKHAIKGDIFFGRVQTIFSKQYLAGTAVVYPRILVADQIKEFIWQRYLAERRKRPETTYEEFINSNSKVLNEFKPEELKIITERGEEIKLCERVYTFDPERLEEIHRFFGQDKGFIVMEEGYKGGTLDSMDVGFISQGVGEKERTGEGEGEKGKGGSIITFTDFIDKRGNKIRTEGSVTIERNELKLFAMSESSLKRLVEKVENSIGRLLNLKGVKVETVDEALKEKEEREEDEEEAWGEGKEELRLEEKFLKQYYKDWCCQKIPALGNKTPKEAVKTEEGRAALKALILSMENHEQHRKRETGKYVPVEKIIRKELKFYE